MIDRVSFQVMNVRSKKSSSRFANDAVLESCPSFASTRSSCSGAKRFPERLREVKLGSSSARAVRMFQDARRLLLRSRTLMSVQVKNEQWPG
jgi:hypothetical protein